MKELHEGSWINAEETCFPKCSGKRAQEVVCFRSTWSLTILLALIPRDCFYMKLPQAIFVVPEVKIFHRIIQPSKLQLSKQRQHINPQPSVKLRLQFLAGPGWPVHLQNVSHRSLHSPSPVVIIGRGFNCCCLSQWQALLQIALGNNASATGHPLK